MAERDDAVARALEAERLSNREIVHELERKLAQVTAQRDEARMGLELARKEHDEYRGFIREFCERSFHFLGEAS
jgi:hypothetical protein